MRALWDYPTLPYQVYVPWPGLDQAWSWQQSADYLHTWLEDHVGPRYESWTWSMWHCLNRDLCGVSFRRSKDSVFFLLRFN